MKPSRQRLEETLRATQALRPLPEVDDDWNRLVMNEIRRQSIDVVGLSSLAGPVVWRFAAISSCLALILCLFALGGDTDLLSLDLFMGDPLLSQSMRLLALGAGL